MTDHASKQTALFFGFLTAAMTAASAQAAPVRAAPAEAAAVHRTASAQETVARPKAAATERRIHQDGADRAKPARAN